MPNLVPTAGLGLITGRIKGSASSEPNYIAWGTGTTAPVAGDTALQTEAAEARVQGTSTQQTGTVTDDTYQVVGTITAAAARAITESGLFTAITGGTMLVRGTFAVLNLDPGDSIEFTWRVTFANA